MKQQTKKKTAKLTATDRAILAGLLKREAEDLGGEYGAILERIRRKLG